MEPEGSLPHSQVPATCPHPEPAPSSQYINIPLPGELSQYYPPIASQLADEISRLLGKSKFHYCSLYPQPRVQIL